MEAPPAPVFRHSWKPGWNIGHAEDSQIPAGNSSPQDVICQRNTKDQRIYTSPRREGMVSILSIDGGGLRNVIPARILANLERILQEKSGNPDARLCDFFDLMAGTSAGGVIALMLSLPDKEGHPAIDAQKVADWWTKSAKAIFQPGWWPRRLAAVRNIWRPRYKVQGFEKLLHTFLEEHCGNANITLKDCIRPTLTTSYDLKHSRPYFFMRESAARSEAHNFRVVDVCRATTAAPSLFKPALITSVDGSQQLICADGGMIANNPTLAAYLHVINDKNCFPPPSDDAESQRSMKDTLILSLGAGEDIPSYDFHRVKKWGLMKWASPLVNVMVWGNGDMVHSNMCVLSQTNGAEENYIRIEILELPGISTRLDNASKKNMEVLQHLADEALKMHGTQVLNLAWEKQETPETNGERLSRLADKLVAEYKARIAAQASDSASTP